MKKNVYMFQADYLHGNNAFLPYAVGTLIASAEADERLADAYCFHSPIFIRERTNDALAKLETPYLVGFSNYIWNFEYNKALAKKIKDRFPDCIIVFGGHHISRDNALLSQENEIDILMFGEGEEVFPLLLTALLEGKSVDCVPNLAFRKEGKITVTSRRVFSRTDYPSPYLSGVFDSIIAEHPELEFLAVTETVRGCPYSCAYCDDGCAACKMRAFPKERSFAELRWFAEHHIGGLGLADSNFGMFEQDVGFVDEMVRLHNECGAFYALQVSYAKNSNDRVFEITKKLNDCGMSKGATLSFQSLSPVALNNIHRANISVDTFTALLNRYNEAGIATYTELILGLPGETYQSFVDGIDILLDAGQHNAIYIHNCEWLPQSTMGDPDYVRKHGIRAAKIPINQPHRTLSAEEITEFSHIVVRTDSMSESDWVNMNLYSVVIQAFHHEGILLCFALYLHFVCGVKYSDFYQALLRFLLTQPQSVGGAVLLNLKDRFIAVTKEQAELVCEDRRFGDVGWPAEEYAVLNVVYEYSRFYDELIPFLRSYFDDGELFDGLFQYQKKVLKKPFDSVRELDCAYDFHSFFFDILCGKGSTEIKKNDCHYTIDRMISVSSWQEYARKVIWYGRKNSRSIYLDEIEVR